jgi:osmotically-inducible protein OsmY
MKAGWSLGKAAVVTLVGVAMMTGGCVLVVGDRGGAGRGDVEWTSRQDRAVPVETRERNGHVAREVESRIRMDTSLAGQDITVASSGDIVTLHGRVDDIGLLEHVMRIAAEAPGVRRVVSRLTVEMEGT